VSDIHKTVDQSLQLISEKKPVEDSNQKNFLVKPDTVYRLLSDARNFEALQGSAEASKQSFEGHSHRKSVHSSFNPSAYATFLLCILFICCIFIFTCLGGCSSFKNLIFVLLYRGKAGRLLWTKNGYTLIPQVNHKSA